MIGVIELPFQIKEVEPCKISVEYVADVDVVREKRQEAVERFRGVKAKGFRKNKAPDRVIKQVMKREIEQVMTKEIVALAYDEVLFETKMKPIGYPQVNNVSLDGTNFYCDLFFLKKPDFELVDYVGIKIPKPHQPSSAVEMAQLMLQELRVKHGDVVPFGDGDFCQEGDKITFDVQCTAGTESVEELSKEGVVYDVGQNWLPNFDVNLYGMEVGEERSFDIPLNESFRDVFNKELNLTFDEDVENLTFKVNLHMGIKNVPCALDDELAKKLNFESFEQLRDNAQGVAAKKSQESYRQLILQQLTNKLVEMNSIDVPSWLALMEAQQLARQSGVDWSNAPEETRVNLNKYAVKSVKLSLILDSIRDREPDCSFSDEEIMRVVQSQLASNNPGQDANAIIQQLQSSGRLVGMVAAWKDQATLEWLLSKVEIVE